MGDRDLLHGIDFLQQEASHGLPLISANLIDPSSKVSFFPPYIIKKVGNIRVAFFGLLSPNLEPAMQKATGGRILVKDPNDLDARLQALKQARNAPQNQDLKRITQEINEQKAQLQKELQRSGASSSGGNRFLWTMVLLDTSFTEDSEVAEWIRQSGIREDKVSK
ncbi:MAG: hypothetical protein QMD03_05505 [Syntrophales bacterium]|nr:hypothetical protein [Syntrophales bacterium]